jgi:hypothetical protein
VGQLSDECCAAQCCSVARESAGGKVVHWTRVSEEQHCVTITIDSWDLDGSSIISKCYK